MRFTQCGILYCYITDVHDNRTPFIRENRATVEQRIAVGSFSTDLQSLGLRTDFETVNFYYINMLKLNYRSSRQLVLIGSYEANGSGSRRTLF